MGKSPESKNIKIQLIRALAIMAVVLIHSNGSQIISVIDRPFINFAVAMFVFLSGYLTKIKTNDLKKIYYKRIVKVLVPYIIWTFIYSLIKSNIGIEMVKSLLTATATTPFYYIFVYIQFVLLTPIIAKLLTSKYKNVGWFITPIYVLIIRYICPFLGIQLGFPFPATIFFAWFIYYYLGMALGNSIIKFDWKFKKTLLAYLIVIILSLCEGFYWYKIENNLDMATTQIRLTSIATSIFACLVAYKYIVDDKIKLNDKFTKILALIGDRSFGIFFVHIAILRLIDKITYIFFNGMVLFFPLRTIIIIFLSFIVVYIGHKIMKHKSWILGL